MRGICSAMIFLRDRRAITPLRKVLLDEKLDSGRRAFAAVVLGGLAGEGDLPWNSGYAQNLNYRAAVETLTRSGAGILDLF